MRFSRSRVGYFILALLASTASRAGELPTVAPDKVGFSTAKLEQVKNVVQDKIEKKETAGVIVLVARHGKIAMLVTAGMMDVEAGKSMQADTIFRIYSMTKPITTVAAMMLFEEGKFQLEDPVSKFLPEFKALRVHDDKNDTVAANREVSIRDLMRHTSGLTYGMGDAPVDKLYLAAKVMAPGDSLADLITKLGKLPLKYQPGTRWNYGVSTDVLGRVVEVASGQSLDEFFKERILKPLDMKDTGFALPKEKLPRFSACYGPGEKGALKVTDAPAKSRYLQKPKFLSGGGGLVSTVRDYARFCQMIANDGELDGTRLLKKESVAMMRTNQLSQEAMKYGANSPYVGFGLGFSVANATGDYGWGGAASTHFWINPKRDMFVIIMQQYMPFHNKVETALKPVINAAISE
jgi:CubicO group peptidase (beta-lactamase class C family)